MSGAKNTTRVTLTASVAEAPAEGLFGRLSFPRPPVRETSRDYRNPYRPAVIRAVNTAGRALAALGFSRPLDADVIVRSAALAAGLPANHTGDSHDYREGLDVLVSSIEAEADLTPVGRMITRGRLIGALKARFRAERLLAGNPAVLDRPLAPPLVITGLQRTGTTLLHRLLANDQRFRSLTAWEVLDPAPPAERGRGEDPRILASRRAEKGAAWMAPDFFAVHPIDHSAPEEEVLLLDGSFRSTVAEAILNVPSYAAWLESVDSTPAYAFMRSLLLLFQSHDRRPFWVLKTPHHLEFLDVLTSVFPEAKVVQTHRDPVKTTGSFLSMVAHGYGMFTDSPDPHSIGRHWLRKCRRMTSRGMEFRASVGSDREASLFLDVSYTDLMADPLNELEKIYRFLGIDFDTAAQRSAVAYLKTHGRHRFGRHVYNLADFDLTAEDIRREFADYTRTYRIREED